MPPIVGVREDNWFSGMLVVMSAPGGGDGFRLVMADSPADIAGHPVGIQPLGAGASCAGIKSSAMASSRSQNSLLVSELRFSVPSSLIRLEK
jgi:hypothetical protein